MDLVRMVTEHKLGEGSDDEPPSKQIMLMVERKKSEEKKNAVNHWKLLRDSMQSTVQAVTKADTKDLVISHGIHHLRKLNHQNRLTSVIFLTDQKVIILCTHSL